MRRFYSPYVHGNVKSELSKYFMFFNFNSTYCSDMSRLYSSYVHGNVISELSEYLIFFNFDWCLYHLAVVAGKILFWKLVNELDITIFLSWRPESWHFMIRKLLHVIVNLHENKCKFCKHFFLIFFSMKIEFDISCKLSLKETICMKYQIQFSQKK